MRQNGHEAKTTAEMEVGRRLHVMSETIRAFAEASTDYRGLLEIVVDRATRLIGDACAMTLLSDDGDWLRSVAVTARHDEAAAVLRSALATHQIRGMEAGLAARVIRTGDPVLLAHVDSEQLSRLIAPEYVDAVVRIGVQGLLAVPLRAHGRTFGALALARYTIGATAFDHEDMALAVSVADHAALAISNARLVDSLQRELQDRRRAEEDAKTFVALVQTSTDFIAMASFDGQILFVNSAGRKLVGLEPDRCVRHLKLSDFHTEDGLARAGVVRAQGRWEGEGVLRHFKTGALIPTHVSSFVARAANGEPLCFATLQRDLRATKRLEAEFQQAQKMEAVGRLAGGVAHDFNNLLTVILSYGAFLGEPQSSAEETREAVQQINRAGQRAAALTRQLLALSRQQTPAPKILDLNAVLRAMNKIVRRVATENVEVAMVLGSDLGRIKADEGQIEQVILNLVINAHDAMPEGGALTLTTKNVEVEDATLDESVPEGSYVVFAVTDTGAGIEEEAKSHIFEPFFTTKAKGKGTGLGLSTVLAIVEQSDGHVRFQSEPRKGTSFHVFLPRVRDLDGLDAGLGSAPVRPRRGNERILLVEDEAQVRKVMGTILRRAGYEVVECSGPDEAILKNEQCRQEIGLLLTDVIMPKTTGLQLAERILHVRPSTKVLYVSGYTEETIGPHGLYEQGVNFLQKPITPDVLLRTVRKVLDA
jgi:PAS domain S-box-containing protein